MKWKLLLENRYFGKVIVCRANVYIVSKYYASMYDDIEIGMEICDELLGPESSQSVVLRIGYV